MPTLDGSIRHWALRFGSALCLVGLVMFEGPANAQVTTAITPTTGAGNLGTTVTQAAETFNIGGGTRPNAGPNLFHSFGEFTIGAPDIANFVNETPALPTSNILSRVTGGNPSQIFGTLQTTEFPGAHFFLMNPAGIVFGPTATLNVGGAINFTTADYLRLSDQNGNAGIFYASPLQSSVLTSAPVVAFGFLSQNPAPIEVQGATLSVPLGQSLSLIGGNITIGADPESGISSSLLAPSGQVRMVSVASSGEVLSESLAYAPNVNGQTFTNFGTITIKEGSTIDVTDNAFEGDLRGGSIVIRGGRLVMDNAVALVNTLGDADGAPVAFSAKMQDGIMLANGTLVIIASLGTGRVGDVHLSAPSVTLSGEAGILALTGDAPSPSISVNAATASFSGGAILLADSFGAGSVGSVTITATESVTITGRSSIGNGTTVRTLTESVAPGGAILITAPSILITDGGLVDTLGLAEGPAGNITLAAQNTVQISSGGTVNSSGGSSTGLINVTADTLTISGKLADQPSLIANLNGGSGQSSDIDIHVRVLEMSDGARIRNEGLQQQSGNISITATESVALSGLSKIAILVNPVEGGAIDIVTPTLTLDQSSIQTTTIGTGRAGAVNIHSDTFVMSSGGQINSNSQGNVGGGGDVNIVVTGLLRASGEGPNDFGTLVPSGINAITTGPGASGRISVTAGTMELLGGARIDSSTSGAGQGGIATVAATGGLSLSGTGTAISSTTSGSGAGGAIQIQAGSLQLSDAASVSAASTGTGNSGTVNIQTGGNFVMSGGTVATSATQGEGGAITVTAGQQVQMNENALISAGSTGPGNAGDILVSAGDAVLLNASKITTEAAQASGGNITLMAPILIQLINSTVSSSVEGGVQTIGGNIVIDPQYVILQNSQIIAQAFQGQGGNISITAGVLLVDGTSVIDASSQFGVSGEVNIQSPLSNLSQVVNPLQRSTLQATALLREGCAVRAQGGMMSSLTVRARDVAPAAPGGLLTGPLLSLEPPAGGTAAPASSQSLVPPPPLLAIAADLLRPLGRSEAFGACGS
jgi:filamentous hemagglutinin family protein